jgi:REP element-mobilizing transposase RayT
LHKYLGGICRNPESPSLIVGGVEDHVHTLCRFGRKQSIADFIRDLKRDSSKWAKPKAPQLANFERQDGYGAFSISPPHVDAVRQYIADQESHHQKVSFQDEFRRLCSKYGIEIDERYVWS